MAITGELCGGSSTSAAAPFPVAMRSALPLKDNAGEKDEDNGDTCQLSAAKPGVATSVGGEHGGRGGWSLVWKAVVTSEFVSRTCFFFFF